MKRFLVAMMNMHTLHTLFEIDNFDFTAVFYFLAVPGITPWITGTKKVPSSFLILPLFASKKGTMTSTSTAS